MEERKLIIPGVYRHFKHTEDGAPNNYMYCVMFVAKAVDKEVIQEFCEPRYKTEVLQIIWAKYTEDKEKQIPLFLIDGEYKFWNGDCNQDLLVYKSLYDDKQPYARPYDMFISAVDRVKHSETTQKYRFEYAGGIQLKNIDLTGYKPAEQMKKVNEEYREFIEAIEEHNYRNLKDNSHMIEEFWDLVQAGLGLLHFEGVEAEEVMAEYPKHLQKMEARGNKPRKKGDN